FSVSGFKFDVKSKKPMPWDPANFTLNYSMNRQKNSDPDYKYENTSDYRGSFQYSYAPYFKPFKPFGKSKSKSKNMKFLKEWEFNWLPQQITFMTNMSRYYYEQQARNEVDVQIEMPVSVSKNFIWDRQFSLTWNFTKTLTMQFNSNTTAHIDEPIGVVNKQLFPDRYKLWKDTVLRSIKNLGTPYNYNQTFNASYKAPFNKIPFLDFLSANATYNATYKWDRGTTVANVASGNTIANQAVLNLDGKLNFETLYNKVKWLSDVNKRFSSSNKRTDNKLLKGKKDTPKKAKRFERTYMLREDTTTLVKHNMRTKKIKITATSGGKTIKLDTKIVDDNSFIIMNRMKQNVKILVTEQLDDKKEEKRGFWVDFAQYSARAVMMVRNVSVRYRNTKSMTLPQFVPEIGKIFGQSTSYDVLAPGLDFAFGFTDESYIDKAKERNWLLCDQNQTSPAIFSRAQEFNMEVTLEPLKGLKIVLTGNRTDNRTSQTQFMNSDNNVMYSGSYTKTHMAIATALRSCSSRNGYESAAFNAFLDNIDIVAERLNQQYEGQTMPDKGFIKGTKYVG
ncbi:MAG: cell surface protein SprA, partial [Bacteroidaceae bacterium]|nr:cell surface protein SprA [Bacteroidaceae bacterium]